MRLTAHIAATVTALGFCVAISSASAEIVLQSFDDVDLVSGPLEFAQSSEIVVTAEPQVLRFDATGVSGPSYEGFVYEFISPVDLTAEEVVELDVTLISGGVTGTRVTLGLESSGAILVAFNFPLLTSPGNYKLAFPVGMPVLEELFDYSSVELWEVYFTSYGASIDDQVPYELTLNSLRAYTVPEPASAALMLLTGLGLTRRSR